MKRLITLSCLIFVTTFSMAELTYNFKADCIYCKNPSRVIDQNEYKALFAEIWRCIKPTPFVSLTTFCQAQHFSYLKAVGTPTALQLIDDLQQLIQEYKKYIKNINSL